jgi:hypothetical protein
MDSITVDGNPEIEQQKTGQLPPVLAGHIFKLQNSFQLHQK